jgi:hypothetical protein
MTSARVRIVLAIGFALGLLTGCSSNAVKPARPIDDVSVRVARPVLDAIPALADVDGLTLPSGRFQLNPAQRAAFEQARILLVNQCRTRFGFSGLSPGGSSATSPLDRRYGITDASEAATWGYHFTPAQGIIRRPDSDVRPEKPGELLVMTGASGGRSAPAPPKTFQGQSIPLGGCTGEAARTLGLPDGLFAVEHQAAFINADSFNQVMTDDRTATVLSRWSICMKDKGYSYKDPTAAVGAFTISTPVPSGLERETAVADVACKTQTNVVGTLYTLEVAYQEEIIAQRRTELDGVRATLDAALVKANDVLAALGQ